jgi:hypothetical protein
VSEAMRQPARFSLTLRGIVGKLIFSGGLKAVEQAIRIQWSLST